MKNSSKFVRPEFYRVHYQRETRTQVLSEDTTMLLHPFTSQIFDKMSFYHSNSCHLWNVSLYSNNSVFSIETFVLIYQLVSCRMSYGIFRWKWLLPRPHFLLAKYMSLLISNTASQQTFTCSRSTIRTLENGAEYLQI